MKLYDTFIIKAWRQYKDCTIAEKAFILLVTMFWCRGLLGFVTAVVERLPLVSIIPLKYAEYAYARDRGSEDFYYKLDERNRFVNSVYQYGYKYAIKQSGLKTRGMDLQIFKLKRIVKTFIGK